MFASKKESSNNAQYHCRFRSVYPRRDCSIVGILPRGSCCRRLDKEHEVTLVLCLDDRDLRAEGSLCAMTLRSLRVMLYAFAPRAGKPVTLEIEATKRYSSQPLFQIKQV